MPRNRPHPHRGTIANVQRIHVTGSSGSGKTTLARALAQRLAIPHLEIDAIHHQPNWQPLEPSLLRAQVEAFVAAERWVVDGNYSAVRDIIWARVDTVVFFDLPRWRVMTQLVPRTVRRMITREELWNGNRERWTNLLTLDPNENLLLWSWTRHALYRSRFEQAMADPQWSHIDFVRLRSRAMVRRFLARA